ncbi:MAG: group I truncated hemoglobin [Kineosporiaceae bacterium]
MSAETTGTESRTLYETLGGAEPLRIAVEEFYVRVLGDPELVGFFEGVDVARVKRHQVLLLSQVLGGPAEYTGRALGEAHAHLDISGSDYDRVVEHLVGTLQGLGVDPSVVHAVEGVVAGVRPDIVKVDD